MPPHELLEKKKRKHFKIFWKSVQKLRSKSSPPLPSPLLSSPPGHTLVTWKLVQQAWVQSSQEWWSIIRTLIIITGFVITRRTELLKQVMWCQQHSSLVCRVSTGEGGVCWWCCGVCWSPLTTQSPAWPLASSPKPANTNTQTHGFTVQLARSVRGSGCSTDSVTSAYFRLLLKNPGWCRHKGLLKAIQFAPLSSLYLLPGCYSSNWGNMGWISKDSLSLLKYAPIKDSLKVMMMLHDPWFSSPYEPNVMWFRRGRKAPNPAW